MKDCLFGLLATVALFIALPVQGQIYKCQDREGRTSLQQAPCAAGQKGGMVASPQETTPQIRQNAPQVPSPDGRYLTSLVAGALAQRDYRRAESLAVTSEHHQMIVAEKRREAEEKRAAREDRRDRRVITNCTAWAPGYATCISN